VTKLPKSDFFVPRLLVFIITFGRKTKKSQPLRLTAKSDGKGTGDMHVAARFLAEASVTNSRRNFAGIDSFGT